MEWYGIHLESPWNPSASPWNPSAIPWNPSESTLHSMDSTLHSMDSTWNNLGKVKYWPPSCPMNTKPVLPFMLPDCAMNFYLTLRLLKGNDMRNLKTNYSDHWRSIIDTRCQDRPMDHGQNARTLDHVHALKTPLELTCLQDESHCSPSMRPTFLYIT